MKDWLSNQIGEGAANVITSLAVLIIVIAAIAITIALLRRMNRNGGTFISGGKGRTPRLSVKDAAAVDRVRRLVLIRRDDVEHLILIGGPTDVVIESNIKTNENLSPWTDEDINHTHIDNNFVNEPILASVALSEKQHLEPSMNFGFEQQNQNRASPQSIREVSSQNPAIHKDRSAFGDLSHVHAPVKETAVTAEIEGRRDPTLSMAANKSFQEPAMDEEFDLMFENELRQAVEKDK